MSRLFVSVTLVGVVGWWGWWSGVGLGRAKTFRLPKDEHIWYK